MGERIFCYVGRLEGNRPSGESYGNNGSYENNKYNMNNKDNKDNEYNEYNEKQ